MRINPLSEKRTSSSSHKVRVVLSSKRGKRKITKAEKIIMLIKQIKQETRITIAAMSIRQIVLLSLQA